MMKGKVEFVKSDTIAIEMRYLNKKIEKITQIVYENIALFPILKEFLQVFQSEIEIRHEYTVWEKKVRKVYSKLEECSMELLLNEFRTTLRVLRPEHIAKFRGLVFEKVMEKHYKGVYSSNNNPTNMFCSGCQILIDGKLIVQKDEIGNHRSSVDLAAQNNKRIECHELKVGPTGFDQLTIAYLEQLYGAMIKVKGDREIEVGAMTLKPRAALHIKFNRKTETQITLYGIEEVSKILQKTL
ncbi:MAG: hypothetical protein ACRCTE_07945 [Cellulosilyticaceae bacterium]